MRLKTLSLGSVICKFRLFFQAWSIDGKEMRFFCRGCRKELGCVTGLLMAYLGLQDMKPGKLSSNQEDIFLTGHLIPFFQSAGSLRFSLSLYFNTLHTLL